MGLYVGLLEIKSSIGRDSACRGPIREASAKSARTHLHRWPLAAIDIDRLVDGPSVDFGFALRAFGVEDVAQGLDRAR